MKGRQQTGHVFGACWHRTGRNLFRPGRFAQQGGPAKLISGGRPDEAARADGRGRAVAGPVIEHRVNQQPEKHWNAAAITRCQCQRGCVAAARAFNANRDALGDQYRVQRRCLGANSALRSCLPAQPGNRFRRQPIVDGYQNATALNGQKLQINRALPRAARDIAASMHVQQRRTTLAARGRISDEHPYGRCAGQAGYQPEGGRRRGGWR